MSQESKIRQGGLMRCCIETITIYQGSDEEGKVIDCAYEKLGNQQLRYRDGAWEWNEDFTLGRS